MTEEIGSRKQFRALQGWRVVFPILIGLGVVVFMFWDEFDAESFQKVTLVQGALLWFICAFVMMVVRDFAYVIRIKIISGSQLSWKQALRVIFLWEFTSAVTPSAIGGTTFAVVYIFKEHISLGKSSAMVMLTSFLDEFYFLIMFPLIIVLVDFSDLFNVTQASGGVEWSSSLMYFAIIGYTLKALFALIVFYGLFINPYGVKKILFRVSRIRFMRKWQRKMIRTGTDIIIASDEYKGKNFKFWLQTIGATFLSWTSRYWVVNFIFLAFFMVSDHILIFARQLAMWIMMIVLPSPGGSGFAELIFSEYLGEFIPDNVVVLVPVLAILWRVITYYPYLLIGVFLLPAWIKKKF
ncbi:MAG: lysylphosphatidylglycerol synthase transmembrane domain-containing protein [Bacteroidales bacterium]